MLDDFFIDDWAPRRSLFFDTFKVDLRDDDKEYSIEAELPGIKKEEINIELNEGKLSISVERVENIDEEKKNYIHKERSISSMQRTIYLKDANAEDISAKLDNGILKIKVPKSDKLDSTHKIEIE